MTKTALKPRLIGPLYERDLNAWSELQADLLRERRFEELDLPNLIEEVRSVGGSDKREIESRLDVLIDHLLKWKFQPGARRNSWTATIREQRMRIARILRGSPSLKHYPREVFGECYLSGRLIASDDTGIDFTLFPETAPFTVDEALDTDFLPIEPGLLGPA